MILDLRPVVTSYGGVFYESI